MVTDGLYFVGNAQRGRGGRRPRPRPGGVGHGVPAQVPRSVASRRTGLMRCGRR